MNRRGETEYENLKRSLREISTRRLPNVCPRIEWAVLGVFVVGTVAYVTQAQSPVFRLRTLVSALLFLFSVLSAYRMSVPFVLQISYADLLRILRPFYIWLYCVFLMLCLSDSFLDLLSEQGQSVLLVALIVVSVSQVLAYFRKGRVWHLFVSAILTGVGVGLSAFGVIALVLGPVVWGVMRRCVFMEFETGNGLVDEVAERLLNQLVDSPAKTMMRMALIVCFLLGLLVAVADQLVGTGRLFAVFNHDWMSGLSLNGIVLLVAVGAVPIVLALEGIRRSSDVMNTFGFGSQVKYLVVSGLTVGFLLLGDDVFAKTHVPIAGDSRYWLLGITVAGFALLLSASVALIDIWCRMSWSDSQVRVRKKGALPRACRLILMVLPIVLVLARIFICLWI